MELTQKQLFAIHFFDERGNSVISQLHLVQEVQRLEAENAKLKHLVAKLMREHEANENRY